MVRTKEAKSLLHRVWVVRVFVSDQEAAIAFFRDVLELPVVLYAPQFKWVEVGPPDERAKIALVEPDPEAAPEIFEWQRAQIGSSTSIVFETKNIDALYDRLKELGVRFPVPPQEMPWGGVMAVFEDPDGNRYQVVEDPDHYKRDYG